MNLFIDKKEKSQCHSYKTFLDKWKFKTAINYFSIIRDEKNCEYTIHFFFEKV